MLISIACVTVGISLYGLILVIDTSPWWSPQYFIPTYGMLLGNSITCGSLVMDRCLQEFRENYDTVERYLSYGASRWEAVKPVMVMALQSGLTPTLNMMMTVGIVSIPVCSCACG